MYKEFLVQADGFPSIWSNTGFCISPYRIVPINIHSVVLHSIIALAHVMLTLKDMGGGGGIQIS
jgi:hypothetical protein